jgi:hypothetical protein
LLGYENPEDLNASEWYVPLARTQGIVPAIAGVVGFGVKLLLADGKNEQKTDIVEIEPSE